MKPTIEYAYLYSDGHLVAVHNRRVKTAAGYIDAKYVVITQHFARCTFPGRIVLQSGGLLPALKQATVHASPSSYQGGSDHTKQHGLQVGSVSWENANGWFHISLMPSLISSGLTYQPDTDEAFHPDLQHWGFDEYPVRIVTPPSPTRTLVPR